MSRTFIRSRSIRPSRGQRAALVTVAVAAAAAAVAGQSDQFETLPVRGQVSMITNGSSNVLLQAGPQGVLLVDTLSEPDAPRLLEVVRGRAGAGPIRYVVNTHADPDFTGGNADGRGGRLATGGGQLRRAGRASAPWTAPCRRRSSSRTRTCSPR